MFRTPTCPNIAGGSHPRGHELRALVFASIRRRTPYGVADMAGRGRDLRRLGAGDLARGVATVVGAVPLGAWFVAWHNSLQHETVHGHPARPRWVGTALGMAALGAVDAVHDLPRPPPRTPSHARADLAPRRPRVVLFRGRALAPHGSGRCARSIVQSNAIGPNAGRPRRLPPSPSGGARPGACSAAIARRRGRDWRTPAR